ncbi:hypothetical protein AMAG_10214 [Allomyces macrogynus ATCC 38327]|uniref:Uncharacterized protein n=1 Tax=Allomyces macrogynus (strain ATCC 38327) TaxID=578462 RepID=A0A0L0SQV6_ALLM3|nr:hypothetical protein AMAG_10214 [Allomyces macrogynus ATCC 38327]|eukprot:KNE64881.1 hypothetical protein AMAG_10214 [Allomyces macrogynus ATCC 38327]
MSSSSSTRRPTPRRPSPRRSTNHRAELDWVMIGYGRWERRHRRAVPQVAATMQAAPAPAPAPAPAREPVHHAAVNDDKESLRRMPSVDSVGAASVTDSLSDELMRLLNGQVQVHEDDAHHDKHDVHNDTDSACGESIATLSPAPSMGNLRAVVAVAPEKPVIVRKPLTLADVPFEILLSITRYLIPSTAALTTAAPPGDDHAHHETDIQQTEDRIRLSTLLALRRTSRSCRTAADAHLAPLVTRAIATLTAAESLARDESLAAHLAARPTLQHNRRFMRYLTRAHLVELAALQAPPPDLQRVVEALIRIRGVDLADKRALPMRGVVVLHSEPTRNAVPWRNYAPGTAPWSLVRRELTRPVVRGWVASLAAHVVDATHRPPWDRKGVAAAREILETLDTTYERMRQVSQPGFHALVVVAACIQYAEAMDAVAQAAERVELMSVRRTRLERVAKALVPPKADEMESKAKKVDAQECLDAVVFAGSRRSLTGSSSNAGHTPWYIAQDAVPLLAPGLE